MPNINTIVQLVEDRSKYKAVLERLKSKRNDHEIGLVYHGYSSCTILPEELKKELKEHAIALCEKMLDLFDKTIIEEANK